MVKRLKFETNNKQIVCRHSGRMVKSKVILDLPLSDPTKSVTAKSVKNFDGIQISVNSDEEEEEELDYDDILDDDQGSVHDMEAVEGGTEMNVDSGDEDKGLLENNQFVATDSDILLGASSATITDEEMVMSNPHLCKLFNKMLDERIRTVNEKGESSSSHVLTTNTPKASLNKVKDPVQIIKSPSDTTIYAPALNKTKHTPEVQLFNSNVIGQPHNNIGNGRCWYKHSTCQVENYSTWTVRSSEKDRSGNY